MNIHKFNIPKVPRNKYSLQNNNVTTTTNSGSLSSQNGIAQDSRIDEIYNYVIKMMGLIEFDDSTKEIILNYNLWARASSDIPNPYIESDGRIYSPLVKGSSVESLGDITAYKPD